MNHESKVVEIPNGRRDEIERLGGKSRGREKKRDKEGIREREREIEKKVSTR